MALRYLEISDIALIDAATVEFSDGLCVLTGETGAGKSLVIDAINAVLGARVARDMIRQGKDAASVTAIFSFDVKDGSDERAMSSIKAALASYGVSFGSETELEIVLSREISASGRSVCRLNGKAASSAALRAIGELAADLHGQHDNHSLLKREKHAELADVFGGKELSLAKEAYASAYAEYAALRREERALREGEAARLRESDMLAFQLAEIRAAKITPGEDERLEAETRMLADAEKISAILGRVIAMLIGGDAVSGEESAVILSGPGVGGGGAGVGAGGGAAGYGGVGDVDGGFGGGVAGAGALERAQEAARSLAQLGRYDASFDAAAEKLREATAVIEEATAVARAARERVGHDPRRLDALTERLDVLDRLKKKYGGSLKAAHTFYKKAAARYATLRKSDARSSELGAELSRSRETLIASARRLTGLRRSACDRIESDVLAALKSLEMPGARLCVSFSTQEDPDAFGPGGADQLEFLFSANMGEEPRPLARIASGGEMSRVMLALKSALADADRIPTMIFDEIDAGIGGLAATRVAEMMHMISRGRQILCVTHLAQIAGMADSHYKIEKGAVGGRVATSVRKLSKEERVGELSRILGGDAPTDASEGLAREMLDKAETFKRRTGAARAD